MMGEFPKEVLQRGYQGGPFGADVGDFGEGDGGEVVGELFAGGGVGIHLEVVLRV